MTNIEPTHRTSRRRKWATMLLAVCGLELLVAAVIGGGGVAVAAGGNGMFVLVLAVLLAGSFGFRRWKQGAGRSIVAAGEPAS